jgi:hypothetical protein
MIIQLNGHITEEGELKLDLPSGLPAGEARITIEIPAEIGEASEALTRSLEIVPLTGAEIVEAGLVGGVGRSGNH